MDKDKNVFFEYRIELELILERFFYKRMREDSNPRYLFSMPVFKTGTLNHSDTHPKISNTFHEKKISLKRKYLEFLFYS